jgi:glycosyltransferase involved in cell wall biosynthesis
LSIPQSVSFSLPPVPIKILAILPALIPSTIIDVVTPLLDLNKARLVDAKITVETFAKNSDIEWCDIAILCRNIHPDTAGWFLHVLKLNKPYIYDIDDNFFDMPADTPLGRYHKDPSRIKMLKEYIRLARLVRVYSVPMYNRAKKINQNVIKVDAPVDWRLVMPIKNRDRLDVVKIVYATSRSKDHLAEIFKPSLIRILEEYSERVQVHFLGYNPSEFRKYPNVFFKPMVFDYESYLKSFSGAGYDIGLAPLLNDVFHRSKTNNKFREYGASHIAGIYSNVDVYSVCVDQNQTGCLVENNSDAWYDAMSMLIQNNDLRLKIQEQAFEFVHANYSQETFAQLWYQQILKTLERPAKKGKSIKSAEKLIADHVRPAFFVIILRAIINLAIRIKDKLKNYMSMYWVLWRIQKKLSEK